MSRTLGQTDAAFHKSVGKRRGVSQLDQESAVADDADTAGLRRAARHRSLCGLLQGPLLWAAAPHPTAEEIKRRLKDILSRPEFQPAEPVNFWLVFLEWLGGFFGSLGGLRETAPIWYWVILIGCIVLLVLLLGHITWTVKRFVFVGDRPRRDGDADEQRIRLSQQYWDEARQRAGQSDFTEAIRYLFLSLVFRFDESGRVHFQRAYTNREYLDLFHDRPAVQERLKVFVDTLDDYWYGQRPTDQHHFEHCLVLYEGLTKA